jgi:hypothetical protein
MVIQKSPIHILGVLSYASSRFVYPCIQIIFDRLMKIAGLEKLEVPYSKNTPAASLSYACKFTDAPLSSAPDSRVPRLSRRSDCSCWFRSPWRRPAARDAETGDLRLEAQKSSRGRNFDGHRALAPSFFSKLSNRGVEFSLSRDNENTAVFHKRKKHEGGS